MTPETPENNSVYSWVREKRREALVHPVSSGIFVSGMESVFCNPQWQPRGRQLVQAQLYKRKTPHQFNCLVAFLTITLLPR